MNSWSKSGTGSSVPRSFPRQKAIKALQTLWGSRVAALHLSDEESRELRLTYISGVTGRAVASCKDLTDSELRQVFDRLRAEERGGGAPDNGALPGCSNAQLFVIRRLEIDLGWKPVPERLRGFLEKMFHVRRADHLSRA